MEKKITSAAYYAAVQLIACRTIVLKSPQNLVHRSNSFMTY